MQTRDYLLMNSNTIELIKIDGYEQAGFHAVVARFDAAARSEFESWLYDNAVETLAWGSIYYKDIRATTNIRRKILKWHFKGYTHFAVNENDATLIALRWSDCLTHKTWTIEENR